MEALSSRRSLVVARCGAWCLEHRGLLRTVVCCCFSAPRRRCCKAGALQPLVAAGLAALFVREQFSKITAGAGLLGVVGVALLVLQPGAALDSVGIIAALAGTVSMATGVVLTKQWGRPVDLISFTAWQLSAGGLVLVPVVLAFEGLPKTMTLTNVAGFGWLAIIGTGFAYANWFSGIQQLPVSTVSFLVLLSPLVATTVGWIVLSQSLRPLQLVGALLVVVAVVVSQLPGLQHRQSG
jgi:probable blue pigment (indigoidine) exporter